MSTEKIETLKKQFGTLADNILAEAMKKRELAHNPPPPWIYLLILFFAYDDILRIVFNPFLFYPVLMFGSMGGVVYTLGLGPLVMSTVKPMIQKGVQDKVNETFKKFDIKFQI